MHYQGNCIRPPSEANSILLQVTLGCSHNKCTFCGSYKDKRFRIKDEDIIHQDIDFASRTMHRQRRLFLMDGDALIIPQRKLLPLLKTINTKLPWLTRVGTYANAKSIGKKSEQDLADLREQKLGIAYLGAESGHNGVLAAVNKGTTAEELIQAGRKIRQAGIKLSVTVLLGIAGTKKSLEHARATGELLTAMDPDYVGALTVMLIPKTPLHDQWRNGDFQLPDEKGILRELREMLGHTTLTRGLFMANHASNYLPIRVRFPDHKEKTLELIDQALQGQVKLKPEWMRAL
ncbi:MAG: radical SAM protein [Desulfovermiculus sp.]